MTKPVIKKAVVAVSMKLNTLSPVPPGQAGLMAGPSGGHLGHRPPGTTGQPMGPPALGGPSPSTAVMVSLCKEVELRVVVLHCFI